MDIDLLSKMVKELILDNDKVVLPGLGAFVAEMVPATFSDKGYTINPPYRRLYFRSKPDEDDALARFYATSNGVDFTVADKVVREFIAELKSILYIRKAVAFPGLGRMRATKENTVFFIADEDLDIYPEGMGLEPISLKTHQETKEEVEAAIVELKAIVEEPVENPADISVEQPVEIEYIPVLPVDEPIKESIKEHAATEEENVTSPSVQSDVTATEKTLKATVSEKSEKAGFWKTFFKAALWMILAIIAFLAIFIAVSHLYPDALDHILYTQEELEILNR